MSRQCSKCDSDGPFYASQPSPSYCIACQKAVTRQRHVQHGAAINAADRAQTRRRILAIPLHLRTRRQQKYLLDLAVPRGKKVCAYCWLVKWLGHYHYARWAASGRDYYCRACRSILKRQQRQAARHKEVA